MILNIESEISQMQKRKLQLATISGGKAASIACGAFRQIFRIREILGPKSHTYVNVGVLWTTLMIKNEE